MKNKAFTLIELLAVIVIIAIITLIATPIISNIVNNSKVGALKSSAYGILEASNLYYAQNGSKGIRFDINENVVSSNDTDKLLNYKGSIKNGTVIIDKKGNTTICITDGTNSAYKNYNDIDVKTVAKETCNIPVSSSIVYLENSGVTRSELSNQELTDLVSTLQTTISNMQSEFNTQLEAISTIANSSTLDKVYPVGSIYISATDDTVAKVAEKLGGTWEVYASGKTLVGVDTNDTDFNIANKTGGEKTHTLTVNEMPSHNHEWRSAMDERTNGSGIWASSSFIGNANNFKQSTGYTSYNYRGLANTGGSQSHNNLQPYITVYMYKRVS